MDPYSGLRGQENGGPRAAVALAAAVLLAVAAVGAAIVGARSSVVSSEVAPDSLHLADLAGRRLVPLDPAWLGDRVASDAALVDIDALRRRSPASTADGSIVTSRADDGAIVVRDGWTGAERARLRAPGPACCPRLSQDGTRVVMLAEWAGQASPARAVLYVLDVTESRAPLTVTIHESGWSARVWTDPDLRYAYQAVYPSSVGREPTLQPLQVVRTDLASGDEQALALRGVLSGAQPTGTKVGMLPAHYYLLPGTALSPDGRRLAILHPDAEALTLVDAERLVIERTQALRPHADRFGWWPRPRVAEAKLIGEGSEKKAVFSPDGRYLYVTGLTWKGDETDPWNFRGLGVRRVDVERGAVVAEALRGEQIDCVLPAADGQSIYVYGPTKPAGPVIAPWPYMLRRLDAQSLATLAEREVDGWQRPQLQPTAWEEWC